MSQLHKTILTPRDITDVRSLGKAVEREFEAVRRVLSGEIEFGHQTNPRDPAETGLASGAAQATSTLAGGHNGTLLNIEGAWVTLDIDTVDAVETFTHNLDVPVESAGVPNVNWLVFRLEHDGTLAAATSALSISYETPDTVAVNEIDLRLYSDGVRTVDGTHPVRATLFFTRAVR